MKHPATRELFAYWSELRGSRSAPERSDIEPAAIRGVLADTFMLEVDDAQRFPFRLAGTRVNGLFDAEQKGRSFLSLWRPEERRNVAGVLFTVVDEAVPVVAGSIAAPHGQEECGFEMILLPLRHRGKTHSRILGAIVNTTKPSWLGLLPVGNLSVQSLRVLDRLPVEPMRQPNRIAVGAQTSSEGGGMSTDAMILAGAAMRATRPTLRVIRGGLDPS